MTTIQKVRYLQADYDDPDRLEALKITNFMAGRPIKQAVAIYSLAMSMSLRGLDHEDFEIAMHAITEACLLGHSEKETDDPNAPHCPVCSGYGTIGVDSPPDQQNICPLCKGSGQPIVE